MIVELRAENGEKTEFKSSCMKKAAEICISQYPDWGITLYPESESESYWNDQEWQEALDTANLEYAIF